MNILLAILISLSPQPSITEPSRYADEWKLPWKVTVAGQQVTARYRPSQDRWIAYADGRAYYAERWTEWLGIPVEPWRKVGEE